ncbi:hypothetical protein HYE82_07045 [Streptomyces sp. BR123]|nr:hypothetical protein [Streptomyces sp. BR123]NXY94153.1 hypothetical protein [Streptomyces sp. BR123]
MLVLGGSQSLLLAIVGEALAGLGRSPGDITVVELRSSDGRWSRRVCVV